ARCGDAAARQLAKPSYRCAPMALGTNTDPYQPIERNWRITRAVLEVLAETRHPVIITTKSARVCEDIDLLAAMAEQNLVGVAISVTSLDPAIARTLEPRACSPAKRLDAIARLAARGIPVGVNIAPVIPAITDHEIERIMAAAASAGARAASYIPVRLPHEVAPLFRAWLDEHYPDRAAKVMHIINDLRGGSDNDPNFGTRMRGQGPWADLLCTRFKRAARVHGLDGPRTRLATERFRRPGGPQGELF
ncbi:MAG: radical SAM protein, partial [Sphingomonadales bacterium]|nr:radical SAM protein [Sphingomonadales bacterium]